MWDTPRRKLRSWEKKTNFPLPKQNSGLPTGQVLVFSSLLLFVFVLKTNKQTKKTPKEKAGVIFHTGTSLRLGRTCWEGRCPPGHALLAWNWGAQDPYQPPTPSPSALRLPQQKSSSASSDTGSEWRQTHPRTDIW